MSLTTDPNDPRLVRKGPDQEPVPQNEVYLVLSEAERAKGFVRPYRAVYVHVGRPGPEYPLRDLTPEEQGCYHSYKYVKYEEYPVEMHPRLGRYWTQEDLDNIGNGCGSETKMSPELAETYAREPHFYGATYCVRCRMHRPVGEVGEFVWRDGSRVGT
jgi:hypothetical protein